MVLKKSLFEEALLGDTLLKNRVVMAPMTRSRATEDGLPTDMMVEYYSQRSTSGLIITEAVNVSPMGVGYLNTPGIYSTAQIEQWSRITDAVHANGGKIFIQLFHAGRISHPSIIKGNTPVAPSPVRPEGKVLTSDGMKEFITPRKLNIEEIHEIILEFKNAALNAKMVNFDGVEIHAANGYLIDQFLVDKTNKRTDEYGGSVENRCRLLNEIIEEISLEIPIHKIGVRLSPSGVFNDMGDSNPKILFSSLIEELNRKNLAYLHLIEAMTYSNKQPQLVKNVGEFYGPLYRGNRILNGEYNKESAMDAIRTNRCEFISFGRDYISNPDLVYRLKHNEGLNELRMDKFYAGGEEGYVDYPSIEKLDV
ncbi:MAG: alkene reductase [Marinifilaceae bacterium]|jgi:N-ethylmaleimide reductase|nr:alkene reductase [Marinifilaceae bacterium]